MVLKRIVKEYSELMKMLEELTGRKEGFLTTAINRYNSDVNLTLLRDLDLVELKEYTEKRLKRKLNNKEFKRITEKITEEIADKAYKLIDSIIEYCPAIEVNIGNKLFFDCRKIDRVLIELQNQFKSVNKERLKIYEDKLLYH